MISFFGSVYAPHRKTESKKRKPHFTLHTRAPSAGGGPMLCRARGSKQPDTEQGAGCVFVHVCLRVPSPAKKRDTESNTGKSKED